ncbi:MAG: ATP--guanido phosphotransferase [candidate division KSB1 bacterium]|nr:ATP--guanido phosphotransferase [candidate division KSB1 bacterium]
MTTPVAQDELRRMAAVPPGWLAAHGPQAERVISTRIRLARNLAGRRFPPHARTDQLEEVLQEVTSRRQTVPAMKHCLYWRVDELSDVERRFLLERRLLSPEVLARPRPAGLLVSPDESFSVMVNEEDHFRLQSLESGLDTTSGWGVLAELDDQLNEAFQLAFSEEFGYLTSCPTNTGTGMRVSVFLHLPGLALSGTLEEVVKQLGFTEFTFRGFYGEGTQAVGNIFQVSNQVTLGRTEEKLLERMARVAEDLIGLEKKALEGLLQTSRVRVEDVVERAVGIIRHARLIGALECVNLLSSLRMGMLAGYLPAHFRVVNELLVLAQSAHLQLREGRQLSDEETDRLRAEYLRERLAGIVT